MSGIEFSAIELLAKLVAFDTTSHKTNIPLITFVKDYLASHGVESHLVPTPDGLKASLYASFGADNAAIGQAGGVGLSGHTDVVPVTGQTWQSDPFELTRRGDKLYGRGTCDMKGFLACVLAMVPQFRARQLKTPLHILFSYDEEVGCTGVRPMIELLGQKLIQPRLIIVGEPTSMGVVEAHKGATRFAIDITGRAAHSSMAHLGANAVMAAGRMIAYLSTLEAGLRETGDELIHTDVVPVTGQTWQSDPFELTRRGDKLYGRGTCDMKGFLACVLAMVPQFRARQLKTPLHILFSYDEEVGCTGVRPMIELLGQKLIQPRLIIVGEPTSMGVVEAHKGATRFAIDITGRAAHSSMAHLGANAVMAAGRMIAYLSTLEAGLRETGDERFSPPYASLQVNVISGGFAQNVIPANCSFSVDIRSLPGVSVSYLHEQIETYAKAEILPDLRAVAPEAAVNVTLSNEIPAFQAGEGSPATSLALQLAGQNETFAVSYGTEAGLFQRGGSSTVICGPGDIAQAHTANEFVDVEQLEKCSAFLSRLADWCEAE